MKRSDTVKGSRAFFVLCRLVVVASLTSAVASHAGRMSREALPAATLYFPPATGAWHQVSATSLGWNTHKLEDALAFAKREQSTSLVILHQGRLVAERYWTLEAGARFAHLLVTTLPDGRTVEDVASIQKSLVAFLMAMACARGLIDYDQPVSVYLGPGWSKTTPEQESVITVRHLLTMSSGLNDSLVYDAPAGTQWFYNTGAYSLLTRILPKITGKELQPLTAEWLLAPVGMRESHWVDRPWARGMGAANTMGFATTARDLARFGLLVLAEGTWDGHRLLTDTTLLRAMLRPSQAMNPNYGRLWWLNRHQSRSPARGTARELPVSTAPSDLVYAWGTLGRMLYTVPSQGLVVVRLGDNPSGHPRSRAFDREFWQLLMASVKGHW